MKTPFLLCLLFLVLCVGSAKAANATLTNFNATYFEVDPNPHAIPTNVIKTKIPSVYINTGVTNLYVTNLFVTNLYATTIITTNPIVGDAVWTNELGIIHPHVVNSTVLATNIVRAGNGVMAGTESWFCKSQILTNGVNYLDAAEHSIFQLISPSTIPSNVQIVLSNGIGPLQWLDLFNLTNAVPSQGAFILTNNTPIPDSLASGVVQLCNQEDWVSTNGCGIRLLFIPPNWVEQYRMDVSGNPTFVTNYFNNVVIYSNLTAKVIRINNVLVNEDSLWKTNIAGGVTNLQPVDLLLQPMIQNGLFVGTNSSAIYGSSLAYNSDGSALVSIHDTTKGDSEYNKLMIASTANGGLSTGFSAAQLTTDTNDVQIRLLSAGALVNPNAFSVDVDPALVTMSISDTNGTQPFVVVPGAGDGSTAYKLGTSKSHTTGNIFEFANNTTNRVIIDPVSTLIGNTVPSPNFSTHAALEVSNFTDRNKALIVDIKAGAGGGGGNDEYPVFFYSQLTNNMSNPTIEMQETSPSGNITTGHTLLKVDETPRATNNVPSIWPSYSATSINAGMFNSATLGGTNGSSMGLLGMANPNILDIGVGLAGYVFSSASNSKSTNVAVSGTVAGLAGSQRGVGGYFEVGKLLMPIIPSSVGVLIDGHDSGAPLLIGQTNGAVQFQFTAGGSLSVGSTNEWKLLSVTEGVTTNITVNINGKTYTFQAW